MLNASQNRIAPKTGRFFPYKRTFRSTSWQYDPEIAADVVEEVGFGTFSRECNLDTAKSWETCIKTKDVAGLAEKIQDHIDAGWWDGYVASTGSLSTEEFARLVIYLYYNKCDQS